jgi:DNA-binding IscR family transcriptional regulator
MTAEFPLAVHALVYLRHTGRLTSSGELADNICTNPARVRKVLSKLHRAGLVEARQGKGSGYLAPAGTDGVTLAAILSALEEVPISMNWRSGDLDRECLVSSGMGAVMDGLYGEMNEQCTAWLRTVTIGSVSDQIFKKEGNTK